MKAGHFFCSSELVTCSESVDKTKKTKNTEITMRVIKVHWSLLSVSRGPSQLKIVLKIVIPEGNTLSRACFAGSFRNVRVRSSSYGYNTLDIEKAIPERRSGLRTKFVHSHLPRAFTQKRSMNASTHVGHDYRPMSKYHALSVTRCRRTEAQSFIASNRTNRFFCYVFVLSD